MTQDELHSKLNYVDATRESRLKFSNLVIEDPPLMEPLVNILFMVDDKISCRAAWILEFTTTKKLSLIFSHLDTFTANLNKLKYESALRPCAKICENLITAYYDKTNFIIDHKLNGSHIQNITEFCFDILIGNHKVAPKAYSMKSLALLANDHDWIKPELKMIIQKDYAQQSAGFRARARQVLKDLGK